ILVACLYRDNRSDAIAIRTRPNQLDTKAVVRGSFVAEQNGRTSVGGHQQIEIAVIINVSIGRRSSDARPAEIGSNGLRGFDEPAASLIVEQVRRLRILHAFLYGLNLILDVTIGNENVQPTVEIVIEEER